MDLNLRNGSLAESGRQLILRFGVWLCAVLLPVAAPAQDANVGKALYNTPLVSGQLSCGAGACHGPDPLARQNRIQNGDEPGGIGFAINTVTQMAFLRGQTTASQLIDIAAYIADPAAATGSPAAHLSSTALAFPTTNIGQFSAARQIIVTNSGTLPLVVGAVSTTDAEFTVSTTCATLAVGANCAISTTFAPTKAGPRTASLQVVHNGAGGASSVALSGTGVGAPTVTLSATSIDFGEVMLPFSSPTHSVAVSNVGHGPFQLTSVLVTGDGFSRESGDCADGTTLEPATACTIRLKFTPLANGPFAGELTIKHNADPLTIAVSLAGFGVSPAPTTRTMTEFLYTPLHYYFMTSRDDEKRLLDSTAGFQRTGLQFKVLISEASGGTGISRYYFDRVALSGSRGAHFYTLLDTEKALLASLNPDNALAPLKPFNEGIDSFAYAPIGSGASASCASGFVPVFRIFRGNQKFPDDPNHRFTTSQTVYQAMVSAGWDDEGIKFCVPE
jgi:hypothetical protein